MRFLGLLLAAMTAAAQVPSTFDNCPPVVQEVLQTLRTTCNLAGVQFALAQANGTDRGVAFAVSPGSPAGFPA
jgi:hypothetical protein